MDDPTQLYSQQGSQGAGKAMNGASSSIANVMDSGGEEIRTLYVVGLPDDIKERELRNLFRFYPAYRGCMLSEKKGKYGGTLAFALFESRAAALEAKAVLDNTPFDQGDPDGPKLSLHLAKKNINPRMLRETRLLTQQSVPSGYGVYTAHLHHAPPVAWAGYVARPPVYSAPAPPAPIGYGTPAAAAASAEPISSSSASSILGIDSFDPEPSSSSSRTWHDHDLGLNINSAWTAAPPVSSPQAIRSSSDRRTNRASQDSFATIGSDGGGLARPPMMPTSF